MNQLAPLGSTRLAHHTPENYYVFLFDGSEWWCAHIKAPTSPWRSKISCITYAVYMIVINTDRADRPCLTACRN
jgi:hypothetical protein